MSFGYIAIAAITIGAAAYSADKARKGQHEVMDAQRDASAEDARQKAELETSTAVAANAKFAADKRARQANVLALGGVTSPLGGGPAGGAAAASPTSVGGSAAVPGSVLGSGAPGGGYVAPKAPRIGGTGGGGSGSGSARMPY